MSFMAPIRKSYSDCIDSKVAAFQIILYFFCKNHFARDGDSLHIFLRDDME